jgi:hypothetical protein
MMLTAPPGLNYRPPTLPGGWLSLDCPGHFENGKFMLPLGQLVVDELWETRRFHRWYMYASELGIRSLVVKVKKELFHLDNDFYLTINFEDMHSVLRRKELDVAQVILYAM